MEYKKTLNLPHTDFPMRANPPKREPEVLDFWEEIGLYDKICNNSGESQSIFCMTSPICQWTPSPGTCAE